MENESSINKFLENVLLCTTSNRQATSSYYRIYQHTYDIGASYQIWHQSKFTGSMFEGFADKVCGDQDSMIIYKEFPLVKPASQNKVEDDEINIVLAEPIEGYPAYVKLKTKNKGSLNNMNVLNSVNEEGYVDGKKLLETLKFKEDTLHGPAMTSLYNKNYPSTGEQDSVPAFACPELPSLSLSFFTRRARSGWPPEKFRKEIQSKGCHVVAAGISGSLENELEWRWSFSVAELELIHHMSQSMYTCMFSMKAIMKKNWIHQESWDKKPFCSYFLKTICLWLNEEVECGALDIVELLCLIIDKLIKCYNEKFMPHYFIPAQNLIGHLNDGLCDCVVDWLNNIKEDLPVVLLNSIDIDGKLIDAIDDFADDKRISLYEQDVEGAEDDYTKFLNYLRENDDADDLLSPLLTQIQPGSHVYVFDQRFRLAECSTFADDPISEAFVKYKDSKETLFAVPEDVLLPVIKALDDIVFEPHAKMYRQSLNRYLGRLYLNLSSYLFGIDKDLSQKSFQKAIEYSELGKEMVHHDGWTDEGFVGMAQLIMCYYLSHRWEEMEQLLKDIKPLLIKAIADEDWRNGFADIPILMTNHLRPIPWQKGDVELFSKLISQFYRILLLINPITFVLYVFARNFIRKGEIAEARISVDEMKAFINSDYAVNPENCAVAQIKIDILEKLLVNCQ